jgi:hypothetical protein
MGFAVEVSPASMIFRVTAVLDAALRQLASTQPAKRRWCRMPRSPASVRCWTGCVDDWQRIEISYAIEQDVERAAH